MTTQSTKIETRFIKDGLVIHENDLGYEFNAMTLRGLIRTHGRGGWTLSHRTVTTTVETTDWR